MRKAARNRWLLLISLLLGSAVFFLPPIPQPQAYHQFADQRTLFGVPNFVNVISNLPYLIIGFLGYRRLATGQGIRLVPGIRHAYRLFFLAVFFVGLGSSYYHLSPDNSTLLWDRLPMAVAFMAFFTMVMAEFVDENMARQLFAPLLFAGIGAVLYWYWSESIGAGDLRAYLVVQFLPVILMPVIFTIGTARFTLGYYFWLVLILYALAKGLELLDRPLYLLTDEAVSGHTLKHLVAAGGPVAIYLLLQRRDFNESKR